MLVVRNALRQRQLEAENRALRARVDRAGKMVGESLLMRQLREQVAMAAPTNGRVLIFGENGTGKELVARTVHALSRRRNQPFVEVNCAAIPEELIESELFGHVKGAFTGAVADRKGKFEAAQNGTIFLDEIGDMSLKTQAKVLRVLQEQVTEPVGSTSRVQVDVRVLAATNKDLLAEIRGGRFREDLYFRLNVIPIFVPPLRERAEDIPLLVEHFVADFAVEYGKRAKTLHPGAMARLQTYRWPGNVRELRNVIERVVIMAPGTRSPTRSRVSGERAPEKPAEDATAPAVPLYTARDQFEREYILRDSRISRAIFHGPPKCLASNAAICTGRCERLVSRRRQAESDEESVAKTRKKSGLRLRQIGMAIQDFLRRSRPCPDLQRAASAGSRSGGRASAGTSPTISLSRTSHHLRRLPGDGIEYRHHRRSRSWSGSSTPGRCRGVEEQPMAFSGRGPPPLARIAEAMRLATPSRWSRGSRCRP